MMISDEQVRRACAYLHQSNNGHAADAGHAHAAASPELVERVRVSLAGMPETRQERVEEARALIAAEGMSSDAIAQKMIGRIISDSIR
jgi:hypothetical protein